MKQLFHIFLALNILMLLSLQIAHSQAGGDPYADRVVTFTPGNPASKCCNDPDRALGAPDFNTNALSGFVSLGVGGSITLEMVDNLLIDGAGADLQIFGDPANDEQWRVEVSQDGASYKSFGLVGELELLDLAQVGLSSAQFVRLTDDGSPNSGISPGAELDALQALHISEPGIATQAPVVETITVSSTAKTFSAEPSPLIDQNWVRLGGPLGGLGYDIRMRPDRHNILYVTDAWAGVHISNDGGLTWTPSNQGITGRTGDSGDAIPVFSLTIDPNNHDILWAGLQFQRGIFKSTDGGVSWQKFDQGVIEQDITFRGFTVQPGDSNVVYAAGEISSWVWAGKEVHGIPFDLTQGVVYKSNDAGEHWQAIWRGDDLARYVWINPNDVNTMYISTGIFDREAANSDPTSMRQKGIPVPGGVGIYKTSDGGQTWRQVNQGLKNLYVGSLYMHPTNPDILLAGAGNNTYPEGSGVYLTVDGGEHWQLVQDSQKCAITSVEFSQSDPQIAYAAGSNFFYRSQDGGNTWKQIFRGNNRWGPIGVNPGFPIDFQVDLDDPERIFANNYGGGNFLSEDGGKTWISASTGYTGADIKGLAVHPENPAIVYANGRSGPFLSVDGGIHWQGINPEDKPGINEGSIISIDPQNPQQMLMAESNSTRLLWSEDGGNHWQESNYDRMTSYEESGLEIGLGGLEVLSYSPAQPGRIYGGFGHNACKANGEPCGSRVQFSVIVSEDGGKTWQHSANVPQDGLPATAILAHPTQADMAWMSMPEAGILRTQDGGKTWQLFGQSLAGQKVMTLALQPGSAEVLYAGMRAGGVYRSQNGGETWQPSSSGMDANEPIFAIAVDPVRKNVVYAGSARSGLFISQDSGQTWVIHNEGLRTRAVHVLIISSDGNTLYAGTRGEGIFRLSTLDQTAFDALKPQAISTPLSVNTPMLPSATIAPANILPATEQPKGLTLPCAGALLIPLGLLGIFWRTKNL